ncbi:hypothetical protein ScPMuIL_003170 [Solemya velum]
MEMDKVETSFRQFEFCNLCKFNHRKRKKHIYSKRHQEILSKILEKFSKKINEALSTMKKPVLRELGFERDAKFWCYFCAEDVVKHQDVGSGTLQYGGLIEHMASQEHSKGTDDFFWKNIVDKKQKTKFLISEADLTRYKTEAELSTRAFLQRQAEDTKRGGYGIQQQDIYRQKFYQWQLRKSMSQARPVRAPSQTASSKPMFGGKITTMASGPGLSCVQVKDTDGGDGNVFTDATPPWLKEDDEEAEAGSKPIGPTVEEYQKHLAREKKKKLPPNRVGANFDHTKPLEAQWLPSFGRVWSTGRRLQSKIFFEKEIKKREHSRGGLTVDSKVPYKKARTEEPPEFYNQTIVPYKKRQKSETVTKQSNFSPQQMIATPLLSSKGTLNQSKPYRQSFSGHHSTSQQTSSYHPPVSDITLGSNSNLVRLPGVNFSNTGQISETAHFSQQTTTPVHKSWLLENKQSGHLLAANIIGAASPHR